MQQLMATAQSYETNGACAKSFNLSWELKYFISTYGHVWHPPLSHHPPSIPLPKHAQKQKQKQIIGNA